MNEEIKCDICGKTGFKSKAGLVGHKKIAHGADTRKTIPDELGKRLDLIDNKITILASSIDGMVSGYAGKGKTKFVEALVESIKLVPMIKSKSIEEMDQALKERDEKYEYAKAIKDSEDKSSKGNMEEGK